MAKKKYPLAVDLQTLRKRTVLSCPRRGKSGALSNANIARRALDPELPLYRLRHRSASMAFSRSVRLPMFGFALHLRHARIRFFPWEQDAPRQFRRPRCMNTT